MRGFQYGFQTLHSSGRSWELGVLSSCMALQKRLSSSSSSTVAGFMMGVCLSPSYMFWCGYFLVCPVWRSCLCGGGLVDKSCPTVATTWTVACQAPFSLGFSKQRYWSGLPFPSPGGLPIPGIKAESPALQADSLPTELWGEHLFRGKLDHQRIEDWMKVYEKKLLLFKENKE